MPILGCFGPITGTIGITPTVIYIQTNDTSATVQTAGYLTKAVQEKLITVINNSTVAWVATVPNPATPNVINCIPFQVSITGHADNLSYSLIPLAFGGSIFVGNVQAGSNGVPGHFISFPPTAASGTLSFTAANQGGNFASAVTNAAFGQATTLTIPDPGVAAANFILSQSAGTQTIATGNLALSVGTLTLGSAGHASSLTLFPGTAGNGTFIIFPLNAGGAFNTTLRNSAMGQSSTINIPDPGNAIGQLLIAAAAAPFTDNHLVVASGTAGKVADAGFQIKSVAQAPVAGGAAAQVVNDAFCTAASNVIAVWNDTTNAVDIQKVTAGVGSFTVTSSADPGASHINYIITKV